MLKVPELKPGQTPYDPAFTNMFPDEAPGHNLLLPDKADPNPAAGGATAELSPEDLLKHLLVKDALTSLHREDDAETAKFLAYSGPQLQDLLPDLKRFLKAQEDKYLAGFKEEGQRRLFQEMSRGYFQNALAQAEALRDRKIREYRQEVCDRQNSELLERALRPENVFNDLLQTDYRNLILYNLESTILDKPESERRQRLDALSRDIYRRIMDKRLELDPQQITVILKAAAVRRVLGEEESALYEEKARTAMRKSEIRRQAYRWLTDNLSPAEVKTLSREAFPDPAEAKEAREEYLTYRYQQNRKQYLARIVDLTRVWRLIKEKDLNPQAIPFWVRHNQPELHTCLKELLNQREANGGAVPDLDYRQFLAFMDSFSPHATADKLQSEAELYQLTLGLGGPDSPAWDVLMRILIGKATPADWNWLENLREARDEFHRQGQSEEATDKSQYQTALNCFLSGFDQARRLMLTKNGTTEMDAISLRELLHKYINSQKG